MSPSSHTRSLNWCKSRGYSPTLSGLRGAMLATNDRAELESIWTAMVALGLMG